MYACARQWGNYAVTLELYMYVCAFVRAYAYAYKTPPGCLRPYTARNVIVTEETVARAWFVVSVSSCLCEWGRAPQTLSHTHTYTRKQTDRRTDTWSLSYRSLVHKYNYYSIHTTTYNSFSFTHSHTHTHIPMRLCEATMPKIASKIEIIIIKATK